MKSVAKVVPLMPVSLTAGTLTSVTLASATTKRLTALSALFLMMVLAGCTNSLKVTGEFPKPLIEPIPQTLGVLYDDDFKTYVYTEDNEDRSKWVIESGPAQVQLFNRVLPELFTQVQEISSLPTPSSPASANMVLYPKLTDFQYSVPRETQFKIYEVWLKYNLSVYSPQGVMIADWIVTAYGKTPTAFMQSDEDAMNAAVIVALRDLGANISLGTRRVPEIKAWIADHTLTSPPVQAQARAAKPGQQASYQE
ncbi:hypothetical protein KOI40_09970 [Aestuariicella sp. G3-2]|uniref:hypothetical protein n=1 Tax=Pseudomaricurvus albidus TaxID=2842452 RepID=UPI001C0C5881|nr:hypothetical protein [Aestuariicella albida]MBU3070147.1 hypothetical protein [Aestuariicella albida]